MVMDESMVNDGDEIGETVEQLCCLVEDKRRCLRTASNANYNKKIQKTVQQRKLKLELDDQASHTYICEHHKEMIHSLRQIKPRKRPGSDRESSPEIETKLKPDVNFLTMPVNTLRRYKKHYKLAAKPGMNKTQLSEVVYKHFKDIRVDEKEVVAYFMYMVKHKRNKHRSDSPVSSPKPHKYHEQM